MNTLTIRVNEREFTSLESGTLTRSIEENSGSFSMISSINDGQGLPAKAGDYVQFLIDGIPKLTGYVDESNGRMTVKEHTASLIVRDTIQDLIDSSVPEDVRNIKTPVSFTSFVEQVIAGVGVNVRVINKVTGLTDFLETEQITAENGVSAMDFINSYARKKQVYLIPSGTGNLIIFRPSDITTQAQLLNQRDNPNNNVLTMTYAFKQQDRYNKYICRSQANIGANLFAEYTVDETNINGEATDDQIRASRILEIQSDESMTAEECQKRADEESNLRRAMATEYNCFVQGFKSNTGEVWDIGQTIKIEDDFADIHGIFLIKSVTYSQDVSQGSLTNISCCTPDAFKVIAGLTTREKRRSNQGPEFQLFDPDDTPRSNR